MSIIPDDIIKMVQNFFEKFSSYSSSNYKEDILKSVSADEKADLEELFQNTEDFYLERAKLLKSNQASYEYLKTEYLSTWEKENPDTTEEQREVAIEDFDRLISEGLLREVEELRKDGRQTNMADIDFGDDADYYEEITSEKPQKDINQQMEKNGNESI